MITLRSIAHVGACVAALASPLFTQGAVGGYVTRADRTTPIEGAPTDSIGRFRIIGIPAGLHTLEARAPGPTVVRGTVGMRDGSRY